MNLVMGLDHMATRVLMGDREHAILEFLTLSPHYLGAYNIGDQNSLDERDEKSQDLR